MSLLLRAWRAWPAMVLSVVLLVPALGRADPLRWKDEIARLATAAPREPGATIFIGSSSIRMWKTLARDFPGRRVLNHGFGGSHLEDSVHYFDQLVRPFAPAAVVLYAGENDIAAGFTPEKVLADFQEFRRALREVAPQTPLVFVSLKPSPSRVAHLAKTARANALIAAECARDPLCRFVDVFTPMLDAQGRPREELFLSDRLHMNAQGYAIWTERVQAALAAPAAVTP